jgi:hypothetical protein
MRRASPHGSKPQLHHGLTVREIRAAVIRPPPNMSDAARADWADKGKSSCRVDYSRRRRRAEVRIGADCTAFAGAALRRDLFSCSCCGRCHGGTPRQLLKRRHWVLLGDAGRGSKGREAQRIKPSVTLDLLAVGVELFAAADPAIAQGPLVKRRRSIAVLRASTPIANGRQGPLEEARTPRNPAPTAVCGLRVDYLHIRAPNATELARDCWTSSCAGHVQCSLMLQTRVSQPCLRDFHAVNGYMPPLGALCGCAAAARLIRTRGGEGANQTDRLFQVCS